MISIYYFVLWYFVQNILFCTIKLPPNIYGFELCLHSCLIILNSSLAAPNKSIFSVGIFDTLEEEVNGQWRWRKQLTIKGLLEFSHSQGSSLYALGPSELHIAHRPSPPNYQEASSDNVETKCYISIQSNALVYTLIARLVWQKCQGTWNFWIFNINIFEPRSGSATTLCLIWFA